MSKEITTPQKMACRSTDAKMRHQNKLVLRKGMQVEVTSYEEGFKGAWYTATIINPPSAKKRRNEALVEFHNLVTVDGSKPLREQTSIADIRPLPPPLDACNDMVKTFEEDDVVDAFYRDGWWTGVVCRVLGGDSYMVYFDSPPDVMEFGVHSLRMHQDWIHGKWVQSKKQHNKFTKSIFSSGQEVEVNLDEDSRRDIWFNAIVIKKFQRGFLVKYKRARDGDESGFPKLKINSLRNIRPIAPLCDDRDYELSEKVEVVNEFGWRVGKVAKVLADRKYEVFFELSQESVQLDHTKLRPHMRWTGGKWIIVSETVTRTKNRKEGKGLSPQLKRKMPKSLKPEVGSRGAATVALLCTNEVVNIESGPSIASVPEAEQATYGNKEVNTNNKKRRGRPSKSNIMSSNKKSRGRPSKSNIMSPVPLKFGESSKGSVKECETCCEAKGHEIVAVGSSNTPTDDDMPLSMLLGGVHSHPRTKMPRLLCYEKPDQHKEYPLESFSASDSENVSNKNMSLPFDKRSPVWKTVESMEVFEKMPQEPHFLPLRKYKEEYREGNAIGMMVTFACIVEKICNLKFDDPRSTFNSALEILEDLENNGFNVNPLQARVLELLSQRDRLSDLQEEAGVIETRIKELTQDQEKFSHEVEDIEKEINPLQERLLLVKSRVEEAYHDISSLRSGLEAINEVMHDTMLEFEKLPVSPF